ncbi:MAG: ferrochelatase [Microthrixaceae bacterium]
MNGRRGALIMAYGSPARPEDLEAYYTHIRRGRPPTPEALEDLRHRYDALGGISTLRQRTADQQHAIHTALDDAEPDGWRVELGQKHAAPFVEDGAGSLIAAGVGDVVGLVLAPHYSGFSVGQYHDRARSRCAAAGVDYTAIDSWWDAEAHLAFQARQVRSALDTLEAPTHTLVTAHSLPLRVLEGDPYEAQLASSAAAICGRAGVDADAWSLGWQSAGRTPEPWAGPDLLDRLRELAAESSVRSVLVVPHGFTSDHLEVAYDLDIEAAEEARGLGLGFARTAVVNDDAAVMSTLANRIRTATHEERP